jgi:hypothetical protein
LTQQFYALTLVQRQKNEQDQEGLGRSCGVFLTKIHAVCDVLGNLFPLPSQFIITLGQLYKLSGMMQARK